ncbi:MAG: ABC transporter ATP-binding protein [Candidatus Tritonobacter lacicola]|nr:ABC transporter ATP-binding protein [Candidatus Tritonobacter lacicola]
MSENVIEIRELVVEYGAGRSARRALDGLSISIARGEIYGFLGPNGAGKTTTIKALLGLVFPKSGDITVLGMRAADIRSHRRLGYLPEVSYFYSFLNAGEIMAMYGRIFGMDKRLIAERTEQVLELVGLRGEEKTLLKHYSKGMLQKVGLAQALLNDPELLILDEPTGGLDPIARIKVREIIRNLKASGKTVFFSSHELSEVELICDHVGIVHGGRLIRSGTLDEILSERKESLERFFIEMIREARP